MDGTDVGFADVLQVGKDTALVFVDVWRIEGTEQDLTRARGIVAASCLTFMDLSSGKDGLLESRSDQGGKYLILLRTAHVDAGIVELVDMVLENYHGIRCRATKKGAVVSLARAAIEQFAADIRARRVVAPNQ